MKLKFHNRARSRIALAGLLAAVSCSSFAQAQKPGTLEAAQSQSSSPTPSPPRPATNGPGSFAPPARPGAAPGVPGAPGAPGVAVQAEGWLKPKIIMPEAPMDEMPTSQSPNGYRGGNSYVGPGMPSRMPQQGRMGQPQGPGQAPGSVSMPGASPNSTDPFAPKSAAATPVPEMPPAPAPGKHGTAATVKHGAASTKNSKDSAEDGPSINLQCTTPEIKAQGVFVGKIQNRYIYKYKSQYCFDTDPQPL